MGGDSLRVAARGVFESVGQLKHSWAESPAAQSTGLQPCDLARYETRPEGSPATAETRIAGDPSGRDIVLPISQASRPVLCAAGASSQKMPIICKRPSGRWHLPEWVFPGIMRGAVRRCARPTNSNHGRFGYRDQEAHLVDR